jgi:hypothetical protein
MNNSKKLAVSLAAAMAVTALAGTSAFADERHLNTTERDRSNATYEHRSDSREQRTEVRSNDRVEAGAYRNRGNDQGQTNAYRNGGNDQRQAEAYRNRGNDQRQTDAYRNRGNDQRQNDAYRNRGNDQRQNDAYRNRGNDQRQAEVYRDRGANRADSYRGSRSGYDDRGRQSMSVQGRISRFAHERGGYRVWVDGGRYPVWIPEARFSLFPRLRVGLSINIGGYLDPLGYVEAYDYYRDGAYGAYGYDSRLLRGVVEDVDYRRGTAVIRDEYSGRYVTALMRERELSRLRPGDFAELSGDWSRGGVFEAYRLEDIRGGRY